MSPCRILFTLAVCWGCSSIAIAQQTYYDFVVTDNGAWTWYNDERAVGKNDRLYTSYVRDDGTTGLTVTDLNTAVRLGVEVPLSTWTEWDDHNNAAILCRQDGKLMAFYTRHSTTMDHSMRISNVDEPRFPWDWEREQTIPATGNATYNNAFQLAAENGRIYNFMRTGGTNPNWMELDALGNVTALDRLLVSNPGHNPYMKYTSNHEDRIDFFFSDGHPRQTDNNLYHFYYRNGAFYQTDGTWIKSKAEHPVFPSEVNRIYTFGELHPTARPWTHSINYDSNLNPVVTFSLQVDREHITYHYARWNPDEQRWQKTQVADAGRGLYDQEEDYTGLIVTNPYRAEQVFLSSNVNPMTGQETPHYEVYTCIIDGDGNPGQWAAITQNSAADNLRPFVPKGIRHENQVVLWFTGVYNTYLEYWTRVVGKFLNRSYQWDGTLPEYEIEGVLIANHPNPVSDEGRVSIKLPDMSEVKAEVVDMMGRTVLHIFSGKLAGDIEHIMRFDMSGHREGMYVMRVTTSYGTVHQQKFIVAHQ